MTTSVPKNVNEFGGVVEGCGYSVMLTVPLVGKLTAVCTGVDAVASEPVETVPPPDPSVPVAPTLGTRLVTDGAMSLAWCPSGDPLVIPARLVTSWAADTGLLTLTVIVRAGPGPGANVGPLHVTVWADTLQPADGSTLT